jgi:hypothetical protein
MRFCDFFISYKIGLKGIQNIIPCTKLPLYRKIAVVTTFALILFGLILSFFKKPIASLATYGIAIFLLLIFVIIDSTKSNLQLMLDEHYAPYSTDRMNMTINILEKYNIDITDKASIDLLISEAESAQLHSDYFLPLKKPLQVLGTIILPIVAYTAQKIGDAATSEEMLTMAIQIIIIAILIFSIVISITPIFKDICYRDYNKYNELIYDLRQIKLFYSKNNISSHGSNEAQ